MTKKTTWRRMVETDMNRRARAKTVSKDRDKLR
jgi:hypothetical protein